MENTSACTTFAVIGLGHIGKRHVAFIEQHPQAKLVALCDVRPLSETKCDATEVPYFSSLEELLTADLEIEVLCICTPNGLHETHTLAALAASKHVVVEKPMALTKAGCERMLHEALTRSRKVFCVMQNRYSPPSQWLKEILGKGILGRIFLVQINCFWNRDERYYKPNNWHGTRELDGGTLFTQFSHFVDMMYWMFGDITDIQARFGDFAHQALTEFEDTGILHFNFVEGGMGVMAYSTAVWDRNLESSLTLIAEKGSVKISGQYMNEVVACHIEEYEMPSLAPTNPPNNYGPYIGSAANHHHVFDNVIKVLQGEETITTNALEGMKVVEMIERVYGQGED